MNIFFLDLCKQNTYIRQKLHCDAKCIYKYQAQEMKQEMKLNDTILTISNTWILLV